MLLTRQTHLAPKSQARGGRAAQTDGSGRLVYDPMVSWRWACRERGVPEVPIGSASSDIEIRRYTAAGSRSEWC